MIADSSTSNASNPSSAVPAIDVKNLTVSYGPVPALLDISLSVPKGQLVGVIGPNGSGKSTLIKSILGFVKPDVGEVKIFGEAADKATGRVAYVPQRESVDWDFPVSALDVVAMGTYRKLGWFKRIGFKQKKEALEALEKVGIGHLADRQISQLSGGQQQRVFLARALVQDAQIYFMDEPFAAVDAATEQAIIELLQELNARGKTVLCVHHDLATVSRYFDHLVLLNMRVVASGPTSETFNRENLQKTYGGKLNLLDDVAEALKNVGR